MAEIIDADFIKQRLSGVSPEHCIRKSDLTKESTSDAESTSYISPASVFVKETGRTYIFDPASTATRDGIRVLTPAGGGRLLMTAPAMTDTEIAASINTPIVTGEPTGFSDSSAVTATHNTTNRTITLGGTWKAYYRGVEVVALTSGWTSPAYGSGLSAGAYLLSYNGSSFSWASLPSANYHDLLICAMVKLASGLCIVLREFHGAELPAAAHMEQHRLAGAYISSGGLLSDWTANSTAAADRRPLISSASFHDEDNVSTISSLTSESYTIFYLSGSGAAVNLSVDQADIIPISGNQPYYNQFTAGAWQQTLMPQGKFGAGFVIAMPVVDDQTGGHFKYRWQIVQPQSVQDTQAAAEAVDFASISLGELSAEYPEITARARIVIQYTGSNWVIKSVQTLTGTYIKGFVSSAPLAQVVTDGTTTTGSGTLSSPISTIGIKAQSGSDIELVLGDSSGVNKVSFKNHTGTEVFNINSLGGGTEATASRSGLMNATQAAVVALYRGSGTTSSRNALTGLAAGQTWYNTDRSTTETYNGTVWLSPGVFQMTNRSGVTLTEGLTVKLNESYNSAVTRTDAYGSQVYGVVVDGGADAAEITVATYGIRNVMVLNYVTVAVGDWLATASDVAGQSYVQYTGDYPPNGAHSQALVASASGSARLVKAMVGIAQHLT